MIIYNFYRTSIKLRWQHVIDFYYAKQVVVDFLLSPSIEDKPLTHLNTLSSTFIVRDNGAFSSSY